MEKQREQFEFEIELLKERIQEHEVRKEKTTKEKKNGLESEHDIQEKELAQNLRDKEPAHNELVEKHGMASADDREITLPQSQERHYLYHRLFNRKVHSGNRFNF